jgi:hypothetical protein
MNKSADDLKNDLMQLAKPYLQHLEELLRQQGVLTDSPVLDVSAEKQRQTPKITNEETMVFMRRLFDLRSIIMTVYNYTTKEKPLPNLIDYINFFNRKKVISFPTQDPHVRTLIEDIQNLNQDDIDEKWVDAFNAEKIDITSNINQLLEYLTDVSMQSIFEKHGFLFNPQLREYKSNQFGISAKKDHSKVILSDVKYRGELTDIKSMVLRAIESLNSYNADYEFASKYIIVLIYTQAQEHETSKAAGQFRKHLVEIEGSLLRKIFFIPISLVKLDDLQPKIESCFSAIEGLEVNFELHVSPLANNKWQGPPEINNLNSAFRFDADKQFGPVLHLRLPSEWKYYIDYSIPINYQAPFQSVSFVVRPRALGALYIEISIKDSSKQFWFKIESGDGEPKMKSNFEYLVYSKFFPFGDWNLVKIDVLKAFTRTFGQSGAVINRIEGVRLRGEIDVAKIYFE